MRAARSKQVAEFRVGVAPRGTCGFAREITELAPQRLSAAPALARCGELGRSPEIELSRATPALLCASRSRLCVCIYVRTCLCM